MDVSEFGLEPYESSVCKPGDRFGRLLILATGKPPGTYHYKAIYQCDCGSPPKATLIGTLRRGDSTNCGCVRQEKTSKHGLWKNPLYGRWRRMMDRCYKPDDRKFKNHGGRGITVCDRWHSVENFVADMAPSFSRNLSLERVDNDGPYSPGNCVWATDRTQRRNRRNNINVTIDGETKVLADWCEHFGLRYQLVWERIKVQGWDPENALRTPPASVESVRFKKRA